MTLLVKASPPAIDSDVVVLEAPPYGPIAAASGDRVFLWWSEAQGGRGLAGHGLCVSAIPAGKLLRVEVELVVLTNCGFGRAQLQPFRAEVSVAPQATLAAKLYRHALNKVVAISAAEERYLDTLFAEA